MHHSSFSAQVVQPPFHNSHSIVCLESFSIFIHCSTMPVANLNAAEIEEAIGKMDPDLLSQLPNNDVNSLIIATISKAMPPSPTIQGDKLAT